MSNVEQRAMLAWCRDNVPDNVRTAHHFINWAGARALAACITDADFNAVACCYEIASQLIKESQ